MTIAIKPTASGSTIEQNGSTILTVDGSGNITPSNNLYPKVPAFSAYQSSSQTINNNTYTKISFQTKEFDTTSDFDNTTNYRYTPSVEGYYQINANMSINGGAVGETLAELYKNGSIIKRTVGFYNANNTYAANVSCLVYMNGSTDYIELYGYQNSGSNKPTYNDSRFTWFQAHLVQQA